VNTPTLIRAIRGAPLTVLMVLLLNRGRTMGTKELVAATGYSAGTVTSALQTLQALQLAQAHARYNGWQTTACVRQLILGEVESASGDTSLVPTKGRERNDADVSTGPAGELESQSLRLPPSSSCRHDPDPDHDQIIDQTTTTTNSEAQNLRLPPPWQELVTLLVKRCAAQPAAARRAIASAYQASYYPSCVRYEILRWLAYSLSEQGKGIKYVGAFITSRIADEITCPDWFATPVDELGREIRRAESAWQSEEEADEGQP
jgi:hypothetical protein